MRDERFEWDDRKAATNRRDHGVTFDLARAAFDDPRSFDADDPDPDEERFNRTCRMVVGEVEYVLTITYTLRDRAQFEWDDPGGDDHHANDEPDEPRIRIISARRATDYECQIYFAPQRP